ILVGFCETLNNIPVCASAIQKAGANFQETIDALQSTNGLVVLQAFAKALLGAIGCVFQKDPLEIVNQLLCQVLGLNFDLKGLLSGENKRDGLLAFLAEAISIGAGFVKGIALSCPKVTDKDRQVVEFASGLIQGLMSSSQLGDDAYEFLKKLNALDLANPDKL